MISMGLVFVAGIVGIILILLLLSYYSNERYDGYKAVNKTFSTFFLLGIILLAFYIYCECYGWEPQEEKTEYTTSYDIISLNSEGDYQMNLSGATAFSIGYISGSMDKQAKYVVFEKIDGKYIRKTYNADNTFIEFNNNDTPHVLIEHKIYVSKGTSPLFKDTIDYNNGKDEITIVVPENTHQMKFNVE